MGDLLITSTGAGLNGSLGLISGTVCLVALALYALFQGASENNDDDDSPGGGLMQPVA